MNTEQEIREIARRVGAIKPALAGIPAVMQGAILADLLAIWLAGHHVEGDARATRKLRADLLAIHLHQVRDLVSIYAEIIGTTP